MIVPLNVNPPLSVNVLSVGELGKNEQSGKLESGVATLGTTIVTVVEGDPRDPETVDTRLNVLLEVVIVIVNGSQERPFPLIFPVGTVHSIAWVNGSVKLKVGDGETRD